MFFAKYYFQAFDWGYATNDPYLVRRISSSKCSACNVYISTLQRVKDRNETVRAGRIVIDSISPITGSFRFKSDYVIDVGLSEERVILDRVGHPPQVVAAAIKDNHSLVFVSWVHRHWQVIEVGAKR